MRRCVACPHDDDRHIVLALVLGSVPGSTTTEHRDSGDVPLGGVIVCPDPDCSCCSTWTLSAPGVDSAAVKAQLPRLSADEARRLAADHDGMDRVRVDLARLRNGERSEGA